MKFKLFKVADVQTTVEELKASPEFQALGLPYPAQAINNWDNGAPKDEYPEWILDVPNYTMEELEEDMGLGMSVMFGSEVRGVSADIGDYIIIIDAEDGDRSPVILVTDKDKDISGYKAPLEAGGRMVAFRRDEEEELAKLNADIDAVIKATPELEGFVSFFKN